MASPDSNIRLWSTTPASNSSTPPQGAPEGMAPSTVNDIMRQQMSDHRFQWQDAEWFCWGDTVSRVSNTSFKVTNDVTTRYLAGRRLKFYDASTLYGTIITSSYSAPDTTVSMTMDSGNLSTSLSNVALGIISPVNNSLPQTNNLSQIAYPVLGRLTLTSGTAVTTSDVTAATTLYFTPYKGNSVTLFDGSSSWFNYTFTELSIAVPSTTNTMYDVFIYNNSGTPALELTAWTNDTTRATALTLQNGVLVKSGATTRRYLGSFRTTGSSGQTEDSLAKRYVWNYYNRVIRAMKVTESTSSWLYSTATFRQANNATANQLDFVIGVSEDMVYAMTNILANNSTATVRNVLAGIGLDSTTVNSADIYPRAALTSVSFNAVYAIFNNLVAAGRHTLVWLEQGNGTDTQGWYSTSGSGLSGIMGRLLA